MDLKLLVVVCFGVMLFFMVWFPLDVFCLVLKGGLIVVVVGLAFIE